MFPIIRKQLQTLVKFCYWCISFLCFLLLKYKCSLHRPQLTTPQFTRPTQYPLCAYFMISNSRLLLPPLSRQRCFLHITPLSSKSLMARFTVLTDRCSSLAMVPIAGQQVLHLLAQLSRYRYTAMALCGRFIL